MQHHPSSTWRFGAVAGAEANPLEQWSVLEVPSDGAARPWTRHLVGRRSDAAKVRVSSPIELLDPVSKRAVTRCGTVYELHGSPGESQPAFDLWRAWKRRWRITEERDVTGEVEALLEHGTWPVA